MSLPIKVVCAVEPSVANLQLGYERRRPRQGNSCTRELLLNKQHVREQTLALKCEVECLTSCLSQTDSEFEIPARDKTLSVSIPRPMFQAEGPSTESGLSGARWRIESTFDALSLLLDLCKLYGFEDKSYSLQRSYDYWWNQSLRCGLIKFLKYKMAAFFSHYSGFELPPQPIGLGRDFPQYLLCGSAGRFITCVMRGDKERARTFALAVLYLKKGLPRPSKAHVDSGVKDTFRILTEEHPPTPCVSSFTGAQTTLDVVSLEVQRTVREVFSGKIYQDCPLPFAPSCKANYVDTRSKFGTVGTLLDLGILRKTQEHLDPFEDLFAYEGLQIDDVGVPNWSPSVISVNSELAPRIKCLFRDVYSRSRLAAKNEFGHTRLVGLSEALKVRVISKGPPLTYFILKPLQKFMHSVLREHPTFALVGVPVSSDLLSERFGKYSGGFLSADYSAATDMLNPQLSRVAVDAICDCCQIPDDLRQRFHIALTGHKIFSQRDLNSGRDQRWGQLMGSIVSFPILCLVNAAICRMAYQEGLSVPVSIHESLSKFRLEQIPLVVNGDDALLRCSHSTFLLWKNYASLAGLSPSVGKVYFHPRYANINSTSFHLNTKIDYVNFGLMLGLTRSSIPVEDDSRTEWEKDHEFLMNIGSRHCELLDSCPLFLRVSVHKSFVRKNWKILRKYDIPWYIPRSRGGLGLRSLLVGVNELGLGGYVCTSPGNRVGPSRSDLISCELQLRSSLPIPCLTNGVEFSARRAWERSIVKIPRSWALPDNEFYQCCVRSQSEQFQSLDLAAYYLAPDRLIRSVDNVRHCRSQLLCLRRYWRRLYAQTSSLPLLEVRKSVQDYVQFLPLLVTCEADDSSSEELD